MGGIVQLEFALLDQDECRSRRCQHFGHRFEVEDCIDRHLLFSIAHGDAESAVANDFAVPRDQRDRAGN